VTLEGLLAVLRRLGPADLSLTAASTLRRLALSGPHRICDLAVREGVTQPAMTQPVSRLERDGLARRYADPADGRGVEVRATPAGRELLRHRRDTRAAELGRLLAGARLAGARQAGARQANAGITAKWTRTGQCNSDQTVMRR
jgi:DNA-binding MarR family transcriptional regulator